MARFSNLRSLLTVFVSFILAVSSVGSYQCMEQQCTNKSCSSAAVCETTVGCFNQIQKFDTSSPETDQMFKEKGCSTGPCSDLECSATLGAQRRFSYSNRCCTSDQCNKEDLSVSPAPAEANGIQCVGYYAEPGIVGLPTLLNCSGNETNCGLVIGTALGSNNPFSFVMAGMGCMTESACNLNVIALNSTNVYTFCFNNHVVSPPGSSVPGSAGLRPTSIATVPILIFLLLLKVLL